MGRKPKSEARREITADQLLRWAERLELTAGEIRSLATLLGDSQFSTLEVEYVPSALAGLEYLDKFAWDARRAWLERPLPNDRQRAATKRKRK